MAEDSQVKDSRSTSPPLRVAAVGNSPDVEFHLEAVAVRDGLEAVALASDSETVGTAERVPGCSVCSFDQLMERTDVDVVFVGGDVSRRVEIAEVLLRNGQHVVLDSSADMERSHVQRLIQAVATNRRFCSVWRPRNAEPDFRRAMKVVASGEAGSICAVRLLRHEMVSAMLPDTMSDVSRERIDQTTLLNLVGDRIAQAVALIDEPVSSVSASSRCEPVSFGTGESTREVNPEAITRMHVVLGCESGASVLLDLGLSFSVPVNTGWIVQGSQGGYHSTRQYITVEDGEVYDVAVELSDFDPYQHLRETIHRWHEASAYEECQEGLRRELCVADILQQIG